VTQAPLIYNLFPRHLPDIESWNQQLPHVAEMGFNAVFVNPFHETGFSGSLYAVKNYFRCNPLFLREGQDPDDWGPIRGFLAGCEQHGLRVIMDLVINHTAKDSPLTEEHPDWYLKNDEGGILSPYCVDPDDASKVTVWGDLAEIDNENSPDREKLWAYWDKVVGFFQEIGITGFRCDAAYQVPAELWQYLISRARKRKPVTAFYAETLGCTVEQIEALEPAGFDYLFNSSKWWQFDAPWALEQHELHRGFAPSIAFPESHDTERLAGEAPGTIEVQKMRYLVAALFSKGLLMTAGYEYGAKTRMNVVQGSVADADEPRQWDISEWIASVNRFKTELPMLCEEGHWHLLNGLEQDCVYLRRTSDDGAKYLDICVNKRLDAPVRPAEVCPIPGEVADAGCVVRPFNGFDELQVPLGQLELGPAELVFVGGMRRAR
jgi:starch synthase (maltosyl-transferring)